MSSSQTEPFPRFARTNSMPMPEDPNGSTTRRRRKSSNLGGDPRGDTGAGSLATSAMSQQNQSPPNTSSTRGPNEKGRATPKRKKAKSLFSRWKRISLKHTWLNPLIVVLVILAAYFIDPGEHNPLHSAIFLSYANPPAHERTHTLPPHIGNVTQYGKGRKDFHFVAFYTIVLSFTREFLMQRLIRPIAVLAGIKNKGKQARFMEQFYTAIYFSIFGPFGLWIMSRTPVWYFNTAGMYEGFPHRAHESYFKAYYLLQAAYWVQQGLVLILLLEKPRKDFKELVLHHIVTVALIWCSYRFHFTYMGIAVYITMDISDFFLATSKIFNYLDWWITPYYFVFFMGVWAYLRHYINLVILWSMLPGGEFETVGPYELNWDTQQYKCLLAQSITSALLVVLQLVNIFWFALIIRILLRIALKGEQKDERSEDEYEDEEDQVEGASLANGDARADPTNPKILLNGIPEHHTAASANGLKR